MKPVPILVLVLSVVAVGGAMYGRVDVENVPIERLAANLEHQIAQEPANVDLRVNLARVHAMAYARKSSTVPQATFGGRALAAPWLGSGVPSHQQFDVRRTGDAGQQAAALDQLTKAIGRYREALTMDSGHSVAKIGLGWSLSEAGEKDEAIRVLREVIAEAWPRDRAKPSVHMRQRSLTEEAARYLMPLLDPVRDREELESLRARVSELGRQPRPITPIAVPLGPGLAATDIEDPAASVLFDVDGSGLPGRWTWITPQAAWLVFDRLQTRSIASGLQLFGNVTFWLFWKHGYEALAALDDNGDGQIARGELDGLALWHDRDSNGRSEPGEVRLLADWGIVALSTAWEIDTAHSDEIPFSPHGVTFADGTTRPTFDVLLWPVAARQGAH